MSIVLISQVSFALEKDLDGAMRSSEHLIHGLLSSNLVKICTITKRSFKNCSGSYI